MTLHECDRCGAHVTSYGRILIENYMSEPKEICLDCQYEVLLWIRRIETKVTA